MIVKKELLYTLLYQALLEIREEAHSKGEKKIFLLANLMHNLPLILSRAKDEKDLLEALEKLKQKSDDLGIRKWLDNTIEQI